MKLLKVYQKCYLILSLILFLLITIFHLTKIISLIYVQITKKNFSIYRADKKVKIVWIVFNASCFIIMLIGFIWDIVLLVKGDIANVVYVIVYFIICFLYFIFSVIDYLYIETITLLVIYRPKVGKIDDEKPVKKENEELEDEANKTKTD